MKYKLEKRQKKWTDFYKKFCYQKSVYTQLYPYFYEA